MGEAALIVRWERRHRTPQTTDAHTVVRSTLRPLGGVGSGGVLRICVQNAFARARTQRTRRQTTRRWALAQRRHVSFEATGRVTWSSERAGPAVRRICARTAVGTLRSFVGYFDELVYKKLHPSCTFVHCPARREHIGRRAPRLFLQVRTLCLPDVVPRPSCHHHRVHWAQTRCSGPLCCWLWRRSWRHAPQRLCTRTAASVTR